MRSVRLSASRAVVVAVVALPGVALAVPACWSGTPHPAELGGCVGTPEAGCTTGNGGAGGGGGGSAHDAGADAGSDADDLDAGLDAGAAASCGQAASALAANAACAPCLAVGPAGNASCCPAEVTCSADPSCLSIMQCELTQSCATVPAQGVAAYNVLARCVLAACPYCPLPTVTQGDP
jgi:hypothetical protein